MQSSLVRYSLRYRDDNLIYLSLQAVTMGCLLKHGYFKEVGGFGSQVYANNEMSETLRESNPLGVKDAVGFM